MTAATVVSVADEIGRGLKYGDKIKIEGSVKSNASMFYINLQKGDSNDPDDVIFQLKPVFQGLFKTLRNSSKGGKWGSAESGGESPFMTGNDFTVTIEGLLANHGGDTFQVDVTTGRGSKRFMYDSPMSLSEVTHIQVVGPATVGKVEIEKGTTV